MKTWNETLDEIVKKYCGASRTQYLNGDFVLPEVIEAEMKDSINNAVKEIVIGNGELHVSHVCPQDNIGCAKFAQRCNTRNHQLNIVDGKQS